MALTIGSSIRRSTSVAPRDGATIDQVFADNAWGLAALL
jgi:hypothetical protein